MTIQTIQPALQAFVSGDTAFIYQFQSVPDFSNDRIFVFSQSENTLYRFSISEGAQFGFNTFVSQSPDGALLFTVCADNQGFLYAPYDTSNFTGISKIDPTSLEIVGSFGVSSSMDNSPHGFPGDPIMCATAANGIPFVFAGSQIPIGVDALSTYVVNGTPGFANGQAAVGGPAGPGANISVCASQTTGDCYALCTASISNQSALFVVKSFIAPQAQLYDPTTFPTANSGITNSALGQILATSVDATWVQINQTGVMVDDTDGNLIANVTGLNASNVGSSYLIKINAATLAIMWKVLVPSPTDDINCLGFGSIKHGRMAYLSEGGLPPASEIIFIDTITGDTFTSSDGLAGVTTLGAQYFNDTLGAIFIYVSFVEDVDSPTLLNETPSSFSGWAALYVMERFSPPFVPGGRQVYTKIWGAPAGV